MSQAFILHRAKQGDKEAITKLLNQSLNFKKVQIINAEIAENCLQLTLESRKVSNQHKLIPFLQDEVGALEIEGIEQVQLISTVIGNEQSAWEAKFTLEEEGSDLIKLANFATTKQDDSETDQVSLELRAKRGEVAAILELINQELEPKNITAQVQLQKGYLKIFIESQFVPDTEECVKLIRQKIMQVKLPLIKKVTVYGKQSQDSWPDWHQDFDNHSPEKEQKAEESKEFTVEKIIKNLPEKVSEKPSNSYHKFLFIATILTAFILGVFAGRLTVPQQNDKNLRVSAIKITQQHHL